MKSTDCGHQTDAHDDDHLRRSRQVLHMSSRTDGRHLTALSQHFAALPEKWNRLI